MFGHWRDDVATQTILLWTFDWCLLKQRKQTRCLTILFISKWIRNYSLHRWWYCICKCCQLYIIWRKTITRMSWISDVNFIVHVKPLWMMVHFFSLQCNTCHETKCSIEIFEHKLLFNCISFAAHFPPFFQQRFQRFFPFSFVKFTWCFWLFNSVTKLNDVHCSVLMPLIAILYGPRELVEN